MGTPALVCFVPGSEETKAVTTIDLLARGGIKITTVSVASGGNLAVTHSRGVKLLADMPLIEVADSGYNVIVLPGGIKDTGRFRDSTLPVETAKQFHHSGHTVAATCTAPTTVLVLHDIFLTGNITGFPTLKDKIPTEQWQNEHAVWGAQVELLTNQRPGTVIDFGPKIIDLLAEREKVYEVASQLVMAAGIYNYYEQCRTW